MLTQLTVCTKLKYLNLRQFEACVWAGDPRAHYDLMWGPMFRGDTPPWYLLLGIIGSLGTTRGHWGQTDLSPGSPHAPMLGQISEESMMKYLDDLFWTHIGLKFKFKRYIGCPIVSNQNEFETKPRQFILKIPRCFWIKYS